MIIIDIECENCGTFFENKIEREISITATEIAIAKIVIRIIGREKIFLFSFALTIRLDMKYSTFINNG